MDMNAPDPPPSTADVEAVARETAKPRIVQFNGKRYSVRLEPIFWRALETLARQERKRLGRLVAELAERHVGLNFSSFLRVYCMFKAEQSLAGASLTPTGASLLDLVRTCPTPGVVLSKHRTIIECNPPFEEWLEQSGETIRGREIGEYLQIRTAVSLNQILQEMAEGQRHVESARILRMSPGRVATAQGTLHGFSVPEQDGFYVVMWLTVRQAMKAFSGPGGTPASR